MKSKRSLYILALILLSLACHVGIVNADPPLSGGYSDASITDPYVIAAANFAAQKLKKGTLVRIVKAESQIVAGINYKIRIELQDPNASTSKLIYEVVVYKPLPVSAQNMQLTSSKELRSDTTGPT